MPAQNNTDKSPKGDSMEDCINFAAAREASRVSLLHRLLIVVCVLVVSVAVVYLTILLAHVFYLSKGDMNRVKMFVDIDEPYEDIIKHTIPTVQNWYRALDDREDLLLYRKRDSITKSSENQTTCILDMVEALNYKVPHTSPHLIKLALTSMGLLEVPVVKKHFTDLLESEQDLHFRYQRAAGCLESNRALEEFACQVPRLVDLGSLKGGLLELFVNEIVVLDVLTVKAFEDLNVMAEIVYAMIDQKEQTIDFFGDIASTVEEHEFYKLKFEGILFAIKGMVNELATNSNYNKEDDIRALHLNVLEATQLDIVNGYDSNARVGLALAANANFSPEFDDNKRIWALGSDWANAYISWNLAFITSLGKINPGKLLMPSLACSVDRVDGDFFMHHRLLSLSAFFLGKSFLLNITPEELEGSFDTEEISKLQKEYRDFMLRDRPCQQKGCGDIFSILAHMSGEANLRNVVLTNPSVDRIERMLYSDCGEFCHGLDQWRGSSRTSPTDHLDDEDHVIYVSYIVWGTVVIAGLCSEFAVWMMFLQGGWNDNFEKSWKLAQLVFPLFGVMAVGLGMHQNFMALLFLVLGLYKFGFPETLVYMYLALYANSSRTFLQRLGDFLNSVGNALHHASASLVVCLFLTGILPPERYVIDPILVMIVQHWFVGLKYVNKTVYVIIELVLEIWVEWSLISQLEVYCYVYNWSAPIAGAGMLVAHWCYVLGAGIDLIAPRNRKISGACDQISDAQDQSEVLTTTSESSVTSSNVATEVQSFPACTEQAVTSAAHLGLRRRAVVSEADT